MQEIFMNMVMATTVGNFITFFQRGLRCWRCFPGRIQPMDPDRTRIQAF